MAYDWPVLRSTRTRCCWSPPHCAHTLDRITRSLARPTSPSRSVRTVRSSSCGFPPTGSRSASMPKRRRAFSRLKVKCSSFHVMPPVRSSPSRSTGPRSRGGPRARVHARRQSMRGQRQHAQAAAPRSPGASSSRSTSRTAWFAFFSFGPSGARACLESGRGGTSPCLGQSKTLYEKVGSSPQGRVAHSCRQSGPLGSRKRL